MTIFKSTVCVGWSPV